MKHKLFLIGMIVLTAATLVAILGHGAAAQQAWENPALDMGYDNDIYDGQGCVWRDDLDDGLPEEEEREAPLEFYIESEPIDVDEVCDYYSSPDFKKLEDYGENALWPPGCFNPINIYELGIWIYALGAFEMNTNYDKWDEAYYAAAGALNKRKNPPAIDVTPSNSSPYKGEELTISAFPQGFKTPLNRLLYGWSRKLQGQEFISQQGLVAGGKAITQVADFQSASGEPLNPPACQRVTRGTEVDANNNRMDDNWERLYSASGTLDPSEDPDGDGVDLSDPAILSQENKPRQEDIENPPPDEYLGIRVTPDTTANSAPGDGIFTNLEEYIWGTNPLDPDSDDDGYGDEMDIVGLGQESFQDISPIDQRDSENNRMSYRVTTVGLSDFVDENNTGHLKVLLDSDEKTVFAGIETDLEANLFNVNETPFTNAVQGSSSLNEGDEIFVQASSSQTEADRAVLDYSWYVEFRNFGDSQASAKVQVPPTPEYTEQDMMNEIGRIGRYTFRHPVIELLNYAPAGYEFQPSPGSILYVTVEITNLVTHEFSLKRIPVSLGSDQAMAITIADLETGEEKAIEDYAAEYCADVTNNTFPQPVFCATQGQSLNEILPWIVFEGSEVKVTAQPIQANTDDVVYVWWVNDELQSEPFGAESQDNNLTIYPNAGTGIYNVKVKGYTKDQYRNEVFKAQIDMSVIGPHAAISYEPVDPVEGSAVNLTAELVNFPESSVAAYSWNVRKPDGSESNLTGKTVTLPGAGAGSYEVELSVDYQGANNSQRILKQQRTIVVASASGATVQLRRVLASMKSVITENTMNLYRFSLIGFVVIIGTLYMLGLIKKKHKK